MNYTFLYIFLCLPIVSVIVAMITMRVNENRETKRKKSKWNSLTDKFCDLYEHVLNHYINEIEGEVEPNPRPSFQSGYLVVGNIKFKTSTKNRLIYTSIRKLEYIKKEFYNQRGFYWLEDFMEVEVPKIEERIENFRSTYKDRLKPVFREERLDHLLKKEIG